MPRRKASYRTRLEQWKWEASAAQGRNVTYDEIEAETGVSYSTLMKHATHVYRRPDFSTAALIVKYLDELNPQQKYTLSDYFVEEVDEDQAVAAAAS